MSYNYEITEGIDGLLNQSSRRSPKVSRVGVLDTMSSSALRPRLRAYVSETLRVVTNAKGPESSKKSGAVPAGPD